MHIDSSIEYCMKDDTRIEGPWEIGTRPKKHGGDRRPAMDFINMGVE
jgi:hypothetical protein